MTGFAARYSKNRILTDVQQNNLFEKKAAVIGCGGLGGYIAEMLCRMGVGNITVCDGDRFDETNLNRQLLATEKTLGSFKAEQAAERIRQVNSEVKVEVFSEYLTEENAGNILKGCDVVLDGLDSPETKLMLQCVCKVHNIPMVHGAIEGWFGQTAVIYPGDDALIKLYGEQTKVDKKDCEDFGNPAFTPAVIAGWQVSEAVKILAESEEVLRGQVLFIDMLTGEMEKVKL